MQIFFPDTKSAALACEQLVASGLPLEIFTLNSPPPATKAKSSPQRSSGLPGPGGTATPEAQSASRTPPAASPRRTFPRHESILFRLSDLFGSGSTSPRLAPTLIDEPTGAILTIRADSLLPEAQEIIRQHGGSLRAAPPAPGAPRPS